MGNSECYDQLIERIRAITPEETVEPNMPVEVVAQEAENTYHWMLPDKQPLTDGGLDWAMAESMPVRTGALRQAESNWFSERFAKDEAVLKWERESPDAYRLRDKLIRDMLFAYRGNPEIYARIQAIDEGNGHADMIQDLSDLSVVGRKYPEQLTALKKFDFGDIGMAERFSSEMANLLAAAKIIRDQAVTYLKTALDEVRAVGRYVFWNR